MRVRRLLRLLRPSRVRRLLVETEKLRRRERRWQGGLSLRRPDLWLDGFLSESAVVYDFETFGKDAYLSDYARLVHTRGINRASVRTLISNKLAWHDHLDVLGFGGSKTEPLGLVEGGTFHALSGDGVGLEDLLHREGAVVIKPISSGGGSGLQILESSDGRILRNGRPIETGTLKRAVDRGRSLIVERRLEQHKYAAALYPRTTNTLRLLTLRDVDTGEPFVAIAVHRIGSERSYPADNWSRGGLSCHIDLSSGEVGPGASFPDGPPLKWHRSHPGTGAELAGVFVPHWHGALELALSLSRSLPYLPYVGWDIVITADGPRVIEGNHYSDVNLLQVHRPLLADERVRRFYRHHGVI